MPVRIFVSLIMGEEKGYHFLIQYSINFKQITIVAMEKFHNFIIGKCKVIQQCGVILFKTIYLETFLTVIWVGWVIGH